MSRKKALMIFFIICIVFFIIGFIAGKYHTNNYKGFQRYIQVNKIISPSNLW